MILKPVRETVENVKRSSEGDIGVLSAKLIVDNKANVLLTPLCRENSRSIFNKANIKIFKTVSDSVEENLRAFFD
ncbi:NifB/NifX family molybdenum-iron cluster-binding protein [endosymbiont 'TC1' of Trimyema compressum]|uniref:NifB/NifX family molybdenum-iron cluster-binding protein n=1 Tax=endosymbiont 'TC1' of Trimyema compressum TaxID=243899 RepID=UPI0013923F2B|nr:NifB/NifX family molybdenum-iron cluster-binding protein [endosymbiont 'TC1' of Trimyema compressum]